MHYRRLIPWYFSTFDFQLLSRTRLLLILVFCTLISDFTYGTWVNAPYTIPIRLSLILVSLRHSLFLSCYALVFLLLFFWEVFSLLDTGLDFFPSPVYHSALVHEYLVLPGQAWRWQRQWRFNL